MIGGEPRPAETAREGTVRLTQHVASPNAERVATPPNILFIMADDLGWNALSCYGNRDVQTPHLDRLAGTGVRFTAAYADAQCSPSRAALLSGQYGARTGLFKVIGEEEPPHAYMRPPAAVSSLSPEIACLPRSLQRAGYVTGISGKWHIADDYSVAPLRSHAQGHYFKNYGFDFAGEALERNEKRDKAVDAITHEIQTFIRSNRDRPWFAYAAHFTTHSVLAAPPELVDKHVARGYTRASNPKALTRERPTADYLAMLEHLDNSVGRLLQTLDELKLTEKTLVIFTSDNGGLGRMASMQPLRESKGSPYEGGIRVPLIARWPERASAGRTCNEPVHLVDFFPTFMELAHSQAPADHRLDGQSLLPLLTDTGKLNRNSLYWHMPTYNVMYGRTPCAVIRSGDWKLIHWFGDWLDTRNAVAELSSAYGQLHLGSRTELYNLKDDISESHDLSAANPSKRQQLMTQLTNWWTETGASMPTRNPEYNAANWASPSK